MLSVSLNDVSSVEPGANSGCGAAVGVGLRGICEAGPPPPRRLFPAGAFLSWPFLPTSPLADFLDCLIDLLVNDFDFLLLANNRRNIA